MPKLLTKDEMTQPEAQVLSLFSGAGGLDIGAQIVGLKTSLAVDVDAGALRLLHEHVGCPILKTDLAEAHPEEVLTHMGGGSDRPLMIIGGPPCTGFSHAGFWIDRKRNGSDPAVTMLGHFARFVKDLTPAVWVLENVPGLTFKTFRAQLETFLSLMRSLDYSVHGKVLNAASFGVPQRRRRFFLVGLAGRHRHFNFPPACFPSDGHRTASWAFDGLCAETNPPEPDEELTGRYAPLLAKVPPGDNYLHFTAKRGHPEPRFRWRSRYWSFLKKLSADEPSSTVPATRVTNNGPFHWENRHLRIREMARLQGFPDSFRLEPTEEHRRYIGNAVPPLLAASVLRAVIDQAEELRVKRPPEALDRCFHLSASVREVSAALEGGNGKKSKGEPPLSDEQSGPSE